MAEAGALTTAAEFSIIALVDGDPDLGPRPWVTAEVGLRLFEQVSPAVEDLHGANKISKETALTDTGDTPNTHDILTGSQAAGRAFTGR
jgi:hypothetical protein